MLYRGLGHDYYTVNIHHYQYYVGAARIKEAYIDTSFCYSYCHVNVSTTAT